MKQTAGLILLSVLVLSGIALVRLRTNALQNIQDTTTTIHNTLVASDCTPTFFEDLQTPLRVKRLVCWQLQLELRSV